MKIALVKLRTQSQNARQKHLKDWQDTKFNVVSTGR